MSTLNDGTEGIDSGTATDEAYAKINTALQKQAQRNWDVQVCRFAGQVLNGVTRGKAIRKNARRFFHVEITADGVVPVADLTLKLLVGGVLLSQVYTLAAGQDHIVADITGNGNGGAGNLDVASDVVVAAQTVNGGNAEDVTVRLHAINYIE